MDTPKSCSDNDEYVVGLKRYTDKETPPAKREPLSVDSKDDKIAYLITELKRITDTAVLDKIFQETIGIVKKADKIITEIKEIPDLMLLDKILKETRGYVLAVRCRTYFNNHKDEMGCEYIRNSIEQLEFIEAEHEIYDDHYSRFAAHFSITCSKKNILGEIYRLKWICSGGHTNRFRVYHINPDKSQHEITDTTFGETILGDSMKWIGRDNLDEYTQMLGRCLFRCIEGAKNEVFVPVRDFDE